VVVGPAEATRGAVVGGSATAAGWVVVAVPVSDPTAVGVVTGTGGEVVLLLSAAGEVVVVVVVEVVVVVVVVVDELEGTTSHSW
jgi:hypothetical protein